MYDVSFGTEQQPIIKFPAAIAAPQQQPQAQVQTAQPGTNNVINIAPQKDTFTPEAKTVTVPNTPQTNTTQRPNIMLFPMSRQMTMKPPEKKFDWDNFYRIAGLATSIILTILIGLSLKPLLGSMGKKPKPDSIFTSYKDDPNIITLSKLPGMEEVKAEFKRKIINPIKHKEIYDSLGVSPKMACLLYGPPGTGKTNFVKSAAKEVGALVAEFEIGSEGNPFVHATPGNILKKAKAITAEADKNPDQIYFVLLDEMDEMLRKSQINTSESKTEEINTLRKALGDLKERKNIAIFGTTNEMYNPLTKTAGDMDAPAINRFTSYIFVDNPDFAARKNALKLYMQEHKELTKDLMKDEAALDKIAELTNGYCYRDLKEKVYDKAIDAITDAMTEAKDKGKNYKNIRLTLETFEEIINGSIKNSNA